MQIETDIRPDVRPTTVRKAVGANQDSTAIGDGSTMAAWRTAVACREKGDSPITAIQRIADALPPHAATLFNVATIAGSIYADTYWSTNQLDADKLAGNMVSAKGWHWADCKIAADDAFSTWSGLLLRGNFNNYGQIPKPGTLTDSPDVLLNGAGPLDPQVMLGQWNSRFYNGTVGFKNYAYGRAASVEIPVDIKRPVLRMFSSDAGFNIPPSSWQQLATFEKSPTSPLQGLSEGPLKAGDRAANTEPFVFEPPGSGHYCLIAVAGTEFFRNDPLTQPGNLDAWKWITFNGAAGWHNMNAAPANEVTLKFANQDASPERFVFEARCSRVPVGTLVSLNASGPKLLSSVDSGQVKIGGEYQVVSAEGVVAGDHLGDLQVRFATPDGQPLPAQAAIEVRMLWVLEPHHPYYEEGVKLSKAANVALVRRPLLLPMGSYTLLGQA